MTDIHSHLLFGVDDGSYNIEESIEMLQEFAKAGFDNVILTPHYIDGSSYNSTYSNNLDNFNILKEKIKESNLNINIYLGNEIFISHNMIDNLNKNIISSLNKTKYVLFELPFHNEILSLRDLILDLKENGYIPVLAHPERYSYYQGDNDKLRELKEETGVLFQCNFASCIGYYGKNSEKTIKYLLKNDLVDFMGTDIHHIDKMDAIKNFNKIESFIKKNGSKEIFEKIINNNDNLVRSI